jgi:hypothetical protein
MPPGLGDAYRDRVIIYQWRGDFASAEVEALHTGGFGRARGDYDWKAQVERHSLGWVCARCAGELAGFVNVAWDGGVHAFILDTVVPRPPWRHGVGTKLVVATREAREAGCEWLHVDFEDHLGVFYFGCCKFRPTNAGLIRLNDPACLSHQPARRIRSAGDRYGLQPLQCWTEQSLLPSGMRGMGYPVTAMPRSIRGSCRRSQQVTPQGHAARHEMPAGLNP